MDDRGTAVAKGSFVRWVSELARAHSRGLAAAARKEGLGPEDAVDAVQEAFQTFLLLPQARSLVEEPRESASLLGVLVRNAARNMRRRHHRARPHEPLEDEPSLAADEASVDEAIERAEEHVRLLGCVNRLAELQRQVVRLRMLQELSGLETAKQLGLEPGRVVNALEAAKELKEGKDDVRIPLDGAGTAWVPELAKEEHKAHGLYAAIGDRIAGVCAYCAGAFGVKDAVIAQGVQLAGEHEGHPSVRRLVHDGYQVITF